MQQHAVEVGGLEARARPATGAACGRVELFRPRMPSAAPGRPPLFVGLLAGPREALSSSSPIRVVVADVHFLPSPAPSLAARRRAESPGAQNRSATRGSRVGASAVVSIRRPRTRRSSPSAMTSQPSARGSKRWMRISSSGGCAASAMAASASAAERASRRISSPVPSWALTPIGSMASVRSASRSSSHRSSTSGRSSLVTTMGIGRSASAGSWSRSSSCTARHSSTGSRAAPSTTPTITRVRSTWRRNA